MLIMRRSKKRIRQRSREWEGGQGRNTTGREYNMGGSREIKEKEEGEAKV